MNILIYATAISSGGGLRILDMYKNSFLDTDDKIYFLLSSNILEPESNINVLVFEKIKKSIIYRAYFNIFKANKVVKNLNIDKIISLNNTRILFTRINQTLYLHQPLPFFDYKPSLLGDSYLWIFKNILGKYIVFSLKKAEHIVTQSFWLRDILINRYNILGEKINVEIPKDTRSNIKPFKSNFIDKKYHFFYPAGYISYKNHTLIIEALLKMKQSSLAKLSITFTLLKDQNKQVKQINKKVVNNNLPVNFIGNIHKDKISDYYETYGLIFPSIVESFGLPLLEAIHSRTPIICLDTVFAREITDGYDKVYFFKDSIELTNILINLIEINDAK